MRPSTLRTRRLRGYKSLCHHRSTTPRRRQPTSGHRRTAARHSSAHPLTGAAMLAHEAHQKQQLCCMADRTQQWVELRAPINGKPVSSTPAAVDDTSMQPLHAASTAARAIGTIEQEALSAELVDVPLPPNSEDGEDMDLYSSRKRCRDSDSSDDEAAAPRKLVVAVPSVQEDTTVDSTTTLQSETTYTSQDSPTHDRGCLCQSRESLRCRR
ncbi:hypothetical protein MTO96_050090 [Rhipicephalus appendiculatus]